MPSAYSLLPTSGSAPTGTVPKRLNAFLRRRPLLTSSLLISLLLVLYLSVFESEHLPDKATISNPTKWTPPSLSGWGSSYDDDGAGAGGGRGKAGMAKAAAERQRCEALWREDGRTAPGGAVVGEGLGEGWSNTGIVGGEGGQDDDEGFSLEREIKKGRDRKDVLREMVSKTNGYYVRDYPLWLGWNNIRYIIEASLLQAELVNRVLVVPTYVYARACEFEPETCQAFAKMVNRGDALESDEWRDSPIEKQWAWLIPTELMIDISLIRRHRPIVTVADYLLLHDLPISLEHPKGEWDRLGYHNTGATLHVFPNNDYDAAVLRVDALPVTASTALANLQKMQKEKPGHEAEGGWTDAQKELSRKARELFAKLKDEKEVWGGQKHYLDWEEVKKELGAGGWIGETDDELMKKLEEVGVYPLHTFRGSHGMEYVRTVTEPLTQVGLVETMRGFKEDFDPIKADVLLLEGETHYWRKPSQLRFTSVPARDDFARMALYSIMPPPMLNAMATRLDQRMRAKVGGRMWTAAHMRRGDFVKHAWVMNNDAYEHFDRIKKWMGTGRDVLREIKASGKTQNYAVPETLTAQDFVLYDPPKDSDPFYIATDERNATVIAYMRDHGAVFVSDLLTAQDRRELAAWPLVFTDVLGVMEQTLLARSSYFYAHALSSVSGGAINHRGSLGKDPRTTKID